MKVYRFDGETGKSIEEFGSIEAMISGIASSKEPATIKVIKLKTNGLVGSHPAENPQLFMVVQGEGHLRGEGTIRTPIQAGQAVFWDLGEWHETSTESGLTAIVIESKALELSQSLPEV